MNKKKDILRKIDLIEPYYNQIRDTIDNAKSNAEWIIRISGTFISLIFVGISYMADITEKTNLIIFISLFLLFISILISIYLWYAMKPSIIYPRLKDPNLAFKIAKKIDLKSIAIWKNKSYNNMLETYNKNVRLLVICYVTFFIGLLLLFFYIELYFLDKIGLQRFFDYVIGFFKNTFTGLI